MMTSNLKMPMHIAKLAAFPLLLILMLALLGGCGNSSETDAATASAAADPTLVATQYGDITGLEADDGTYQWRGVPYAKPPVGDLRWKPPVAPDPWMETLDCSEYRNQAAQNSVSAGFGLGGVSEDCLNLNITAPKDAVHLPVMVWLHGGFFSVLTANNAAYNNPGGIPSRGIVLVTVNHRLGPFGYLAHPWLTDESSYGGSGNYGQMDLIMALEWVRDNVEAFGGDPDNVTLFGESGGGAKVISLMTANPELIAPGGTPLFHRAICQSGMATASDQAFPDDSIRPFETLADAESEGADFVRLLETNLGITISNLDDLRALTWEQIIDNAPYEDNEPNPTGIGKIRYAPNVDKEGDSQGYYMLETMEDAISNGRQLQVPFIAGTTEGDGRFLTPGYTRLIDRFEDTHTEPIYAYVFTHVPAGWRAEGVMAYHAIELAYLFDSTASFPVHVAMTLPQRTIDYCTPGNVTNITSDPGIDPTEFDTVTDYMITMWTNFAKNGDPSYTAGNYPDGPQWVAFSEANQSQYLEISTTLNMQSNLSDDVFPSYSPCTEIKAVKGITRHRRK